MSVQLRLASSDVADMLTFVYFILFCAFVLHVSRCHFWHTHQLIERYSDDLSMKVILKHQ